MFLVSRYPLIAMGVVIVALAVVVEVLSRLSCRQDKGATQPPKKPLGRTLARLSFVFGVTLIVLGLVTLPN